jgi:hypothetical protein
MANKIPIPADGNVQGIRRALAMLVERLSEVSNQQFANLSLTDLTAARLVSSDANKKLVSTDLVNWVAGGTGVTITDDTDGTITVAAPSSHDAVTISDTASVDLALVGQALSAAVLPAGVDHNSLNNYAADRHFLQTSIDHISTALSTGLVKVTTGTGLLSVVTDNSANWDTAYTDRLKWDGGSAGLTASTGRTSLGLSSTDSPTFADITDSGLTASRVVLTNGSKKLVTTALSAVNVYRGSNQTSPTPIGWDKVLLDTEVYDDGAEFDSTTNNRFTAANAGIYLVSAQVSISGMDADKAIGIMIKKNGNEYAYTISYVPTGAVVTRLPFVTTIKLAASDYLELFYFTEQTGKTLYYGGVNDNVMCITRILQ